MPRRNYRFQKMRPEEVPFYRELNRASSQDPIYKPPCRNRKGRKKKCQKRDQQESE